MNDAVNDDAPLRPVPARHLVVVGLGLVGGSVCRALRAAYPSLRLSGVDREAIVSLASDQGVINDGVALDDDEAIGVLLRGADVALLALPVLSVVAFLERHAGALANVIVTDTGSTKQVVVDAAAKLGLRSFIGGHPMAGRTGQGLAAADPRLFDGARWFLCADGDVDADAIARVRTLVTAMGAAPVEIGAAEHDRDVALTSHLPHLVANTIAEAVLAGGALDAAGGSLRAVLAVAGASFDVWGDTIQTNQPAIDAALDELIARLTMLRRHLGDSERLRELFAHGRAVRERLDG